jgi:hypothetical protein
MSGGLSRTEIKKGDLVKVINQVDNYRTKFPKQLKLGEIYEVIGVCDDYFNGHTLIFEVNGEKITCTPLGFSHSNNIKDKVRFEVISNPNVKSWSI